jgi:hypothetical protein
LLYEIQTHPHVSAGKTTIFDPFLMKSMVFAYLSSIFPCFLESFIDNPQISAAPGGILSRLPGRTAAMAARAAMATQPGRDGRSGFSDAAAPGRARWATVNGDDLPLVMMGFYTWIMMGIIMVNSG